LTRYEGRVGRIRQQLNDLIRQQEILIQLLNEEAAKSHSFTL